MVNHVPFPQSRVVFQNQKLMLNLFLLAFCIRYCLTLQLLPDVQSFTYYHVSFCETRDTQYYSSKQSHFATYLIIQYLLLFNYHHYIYGLHLLMWLYEYLYTESREFVIFHLYGVNSFMVSHGYWYIPEIGINMGLKCIYSTSIHRDEIPQKFKKKVKKHFIFCYSESPNIGSCVCWEVELCATFWKGVCKNSVPEIIFVFRGWFVLCLGAVYDQFSIPRFPL